MNESNIILNSPLNLNVRYTLCVCELPGVMASYYYPSHASSCLSSLFALKEPHESMEFMQTTGEPLNVLSKFLFSQIDVNPMESTQNQIQISPQ